MQSGYHLVATTTPAPLCSFFAIITHRMIAYHFLAETCIIETGSKRVSRRWNDLKSSKGQNFSTLLLIYAVLSYDCLTQ